MPSPPPRSISGSSTPCSSRTSASSPTTRRAATSNPDMSKICEPMCEWMPMSSRPSSWSTRRTASAACPPASANAELLVLVGGGDELVGVRLDADGDADLHALPPAELAAAMCATRTISWKESSTIRPTPGLDGPLDLVRGLVVAVEGDALGGHAGRERGGQLAAGADVEVEPFLVQPAHDGAREERLAGVEDVGVGAEGAAPGPAARPEVGLVEDVGGRAELLGEPLDVDAADGDDAVRVAADGLGPDLGVEGVEVGGRGGVVALGQHVGVTGPGGVCGTAHGLQSLCFALRGVRVR